MDEVYKKIEQQVELAKRWGFQDVFVKIPVSVAEKMVQKDHPATLVPK